MDLNPESASQRRRAREQGARKSMNESILIDFKRCEEPLPVTSFRGLRGNNGESGLVLDGETSAQARGVALRLQARDVMTQRAADQVRRRYNWTSTTRYDVQLAREGERLRLDGIDAQALPPGSYKLEFRIGGLELERSSHTIRIPRNGQANITLTEKDTGRRLLLDRPLGSYDDGTKAILLHRASQLDGVSAVEWLEKGRRRDRRKACLLNILAKFATLPTPNSPLNQHVRNVFFADIDRIYCAVEPSMLGRLQKSKCFRRQQGAVHSTHKKILLRLPAAGGPYELVSYREAKHPSLQVTLAIPPAGAAGKTHYADIDIDLGNPTLDVAGLFIHLGELLDPRQTDHLKLRSKLTKQGTADFLYYTIEKV